MPLAGALTYTRDELLRSFGRQFQDGSKPLTSAHIDVIEEKQVARKPDWKKGDPLLVYWKDIADATGATARPGDF